MTKTLDQFTNDFVENYSNLVAEGAISTGVNAGRDFFNRDNLQGARYSAILDTKVCAYCRSLDGKTIRLDDPAYVSGEYDPPQHPYCLVSAKTPIFTEDGWKRIKDVQEGDRVLTHKGRFRKVTKKFVIPQQRITKTWIQFSCGADNGKQELVLTSDHPVFSDGKWVPAQNLKIGQQLQMLASTCLRCGKSISYLGKYCSRTCLSLDITDRQWSNPKHRDLMAQKAQQQMKREYLNGVRDKNAITRRAREVMSQLISEGKRKWGFCDPKVLKKAKLNNFTPEIRKRHSERMKKNNPMYIPEFQERRAISYKKFIQEHPEKHPNVIMAQKGFISSLEKKMKLLLQQIGIPFEHQYPILNFFVDFAIPSLKIAIECDGTYWHSETAEVDRLRQQKIEAEGWTMIRFLEDEIITRSAEIVPRILRIVANHIGAYHFIPCIITGIKTTSQKRLVTLWNLSVEEDESFLAKGIVVHNCRCVWVYISKKEKDVPFDWQDPPPELREKHASWNQELPWQLKYELGKLEKVVKNIAKEDLRAIVQPIKEPVLSVKISPWEWTLQEMRKQSQGKTQTHQMVPKVPQSKIGDTIDFIRFGKPVEHSINWQTGQAELGMSVYEVDISGAAKQAVRSEFEGRVAYKGRGIIVGVGSDGEPLVANFKTHKISEEEAEKAIYFGMTRKQYLEAKGNPDKIHRVLVENMLSAGKGVSPEVLKDYPELEKSKKRRKSKTP